MASILMAPTHSWHTHSELKCAQMAKCARTHSELHFPTSRPSISALHCTSSPCLQVVCPLLAWQLLPILVIQIGLAGAKG